jgi:hypothetical protein
MSELPLIPQTGSKQPIDPNDYIGVDISKMSSSERAKIESAFRKHTGEGFTGSKYDPKSPTFAYGPEPTSQPSNQDNDYGGETQRDQIGRGQLQGKDNIARNSFKVS